MYSSNPMNTTQSDFCVNVAGHVIVKNIDESRLDSNKNIVASPLSLHVMLNMLASGSSGSTLDQLLWFIGLRTIDDVNNQSIQNMKLMNPKLTNPEVVGDKQVLHAPAVPVMQQHPPPSSPSLDACNQSLRPMNLNDPMFGGYPQPYVPAVQPYLSSKPYVAAVQSYRSPRREDAPITSFVHGAWIDHQYPIKPSFQEILKHFYDTEARSVDFQLDGEEVRKEVNSWASSATNGLIDNLLPPTCFDTTMLVLANALYFKGTWKNPFYRQNTKDEVFYLPNGNTASVPFMKRNGGTHYVGFFEDFKVLKMQYERSHDTREFSMFIYLPNSLHGLAELTQTLNSHPIYVHNIDQYLKKEALSDMWIPKFKFSYEFEASDTMRELGLTLPFDRADAQLTGMVDSKYGPYVSKLIHKAYIEVNETGTEAAACTAAFYSPTGHYVKPPTPRPSFIADHPFLFVLKEETSQTVFFIGSIVNPLAQS